jgi:hypothetical protein
LPPETPPRGDDSVLVNGDYDDLWSDVTRFFEDYDKPIKLVDKGSGIIVTTSEDVASGEFADCGTGYAKPPQISQQYTVYLRETRSGEQMLRVKMFYEGGKFGKCVSTGKAEEEFLNQIIEYTKT